MSADAWGVFSDEGMVSGPYYTEVGAIAGRLLDDPTEESDLTVQPCCRDHESEPSIGCQLCAEDEDTDNEEGDE